MLAIEFPPISHLLNWPAFWMKDSTFFAVNKVAIISRDEAKDYVDLYVILQETPYRLTDLIPLAKQKLLGLDEWAIADKFRRVRRVMNVAGFLESYMVKPVDWRALVQYYEDRAEELAALFPPQSEDPRDRD